MNNAHKRLYTYAALHKRPAEPQPLLNLSTSDGYWTFTFDAADSDLVWGMCKYACKHRILQHAHKFTLEPCKTQVRAYIHDCDRATVMDFGIALTTYFKPILKSPLTFHRFHADSLTIHRDDV